VLLKGLFKPCEGLVHGPEPRVDGCSAIWQHISSPRELEELAEYIPGFFPASGCRAGVPQGRQIYGISSGNARRQRSLDTQGLCSKLHFEEPPGPGGRQP
jgi:hypothetical protein